MLPTNPTRTHKWLCSISLIKFFLFLAAYGGQNSNHSYTPTSTIQICDNNIFLKAGICCAIVPLTCTCFKKNIDLGCFQVHISSQNHDLSRYPVQRMDEVVRTITAFGESPAKGGPLILVRHADGEPDEGFFSECEGQGAPQRFQYR
jgi:hypothetical protein